MYKYIKTIDRMDSMCYNIHNKIERIGYVKKVGLVMNVKK